MLEHSPAVPGQDPVGETSNFSPPRERDVIVRAGRGLSGLPEPRHPRRARSVDRTGARPAGRPTARANRLQAVRSTYFPAGQRPAPAAGVLTDSDRATTYQPVNRPSGATPAPDRNGHRGSNIPSRIDFTPTPLRRRCRRRLRRLRPCQNRHRHLLLKFPAHRSLRPLSPVATPPFSAARLCAAGNGTGPLTLPLALRWHCPESRRNRRRHRGRGNEAGARSHEQTAFMGAL